MKNLFDQIKLLYEQELYSNVVRLCSLAISVCDQKPEIVTPIVKCQMYIQYADSIYHLEQYSKAEVIYFQALQQRKNIMKNKSATKPTENLKDLSDIDIKYKIHLCHVKLKQYQKAINILQSISARARNAKINMALGNLYRDSGMERSAITCYKEVLRESPLALEAAESLLTLGVKGIEVNSLMLVGTSDVMTTAWVNQWLRGMAEVQIRDYRTGITTFQAMDSPGLLKDNVTLLTMLGQCFHYSGDDKNSLAYLQRAINIDPHMQTGLDVLASLLSNEEELEKLIPVDLELTQYGPEHWVAMGYYMYTTKKYSKAAYFAQKACIMAPRNVEALLLKGRILVDLNKFQDAAVHMREALQIAPYRYETYEHLVMCYVGLNRVREATTVASNACKQLGHTPRVLTLYASVLMRDPMTVPKAKSLLERAVRQDVDGSGTFLPAVYILVECYQQEMALESAAALLTKHAEQTPNSKLHQMLGDVFARLYKDDKAFEHYNIALNLNPRNRRAFEGLHSLGRSADSSKLDSSYYMGTGGTTQGGGGGGGGGGEGPTQPLSDHEPEADEDNDLGLLTYAEMRDLSWPM